MIKKNVLQKCKRMKILEVGNFWGHKMNLGVLNKAFEVHRPNSEQENENVYSYKAAQNYKGIPSIQDRDYSHQPHTINNCKRPQIQTPCPVPLLQKIDTVHYFPTNVEPRHLASAA